MAHAERRGATGVARSASEHDEVQASGSSVGAGRSRRGPGRRGKAGPMLLEKEEFGGVTLLACMTHSR